MNPVSSPAVDSLASITEPPEPPTTPVEPLATAPDQDRPMAVPPTNPIDAPAVADDNEPEPATKKAQRTTRNKKGKGSGRGARA